EPLLDLAVEHVERLVSLALIERLADAGNRREPRAERRDDLAVHHVVGLAKQRSPFRVTDDGVLRARLAHHGRADLAGERALALPVVILRGNRDVAVARGLEGGVNRR